MEQAGQELESEVVVVGAGAAGLWAAERAARAGRSVLLVEKTPRAGTKVLASGGTRCNLTTTLGPKPAAALFGRHGARFLDTGFRVLPPSAVRARFEELGVPTVEAPLEKVFPASGRAVDVRDALLGAALAAGARIVYDAPVERIEARPDGTWTLLVAGGRRVHAPRVILCPGGKSYPRTGTTGDGYRWLDDLGLEEVEPVPALAPLASPAAWVRELAGISIQGGEARLVDAAGAVLARRRRPVLFTHRGVSGPGAMDLSEPVARARAAADRGGPPVALALRVDLLPDVTSDALRELLLAAAARPGSPPLSRVLPCEVPRRLLEAVVRQAGVRESDPRANQIERAARARLLDALKGLTIPVDGTLGFDWAEVTAGGLALGEVDPGSLAVKRHPGLFVIGELLDLQGPIGGLNFQAAFATAELAGVAAAR
ncbi:MAG: aminoacetone oxidase family FAD-binding enzyme [Planctomycetes bacterium]|nr:aminoacetone oxidase family FAD-binding enzyme [Planctomycetota bacterium]